MAAEKFILAMVISLAFQPNVLKPLCHLHKHVRLVSERLSTASFVSGNTSADSSRRSRVRREPSSRSRRDKKLKKPEEEKSINVSNFFDLLSMLCK